MNSQNGNAGQFGARVLAIGYWAGVLVILVLVLVSIDIQLFELSGLPHESSAYVQGAVTSILLLIAIALVFRGMTAEKKVKKALQSERWHLDNVIKSTNIGTWRWNMQTGEIV